jgi:hypothetical protein
MLSHCDPSGREVNTLNSIIYIIGLVVVIAVVLSFLGFA